MSQNRDKGFTLIEILIYVGLFAVVAAIVFGILVAFTRIGEQESTSAEVTNQLNFVMQTIQQLVRASSNIDMPVAVTTSTLRLRMASSTGDPTLIYLSGGAIQIEQGQAPATVLTNNRVVVNALNFQKSSQYPGHDSVSIDITMTYNTRDPATQVARSLHSAIARISAATFDADVLPGGPPYNFNIGQSGSPWQNLYLSGVLNLGTAASDPAGAQNGSLYYNTSNNVFRGYASGTWSNLAGGYWSASGTAIYNNNTGNVGVGTPNPGAKLEVAGTLRFSSVDCIAGTCPPNQAIRLTPNLHLNSSPGYAVIVNWDNGTTGSAQTFRVGNGAGSDAFYVLANGTVWTAGSLTAAGTVNAASGGINRSWVALNHTASNVACGTCPTVPAVAPISCPSGWTVYQQIDLGSTLSCTPRGSCGGGESGNSDYITDRSWADICYKNF